MEYVVQHLKVLRNLVHAETNARCPKTGFYAGPYTQAGGDQVGVEWVALLKFCRTAFFH